MQNINAKFAKQSFVTTSCHFFLNILNEEIFSLAPSA